MHRIVVFVLAVLLMACQQSPRESGIDLAAMDTTVRPQDNFYLYMNGTWVKNFEIPADKPYYGVFTRLRDKSDEDVRAIIEEAAATTDAPRGSDPQKVGDMFRSFMDSTRAEELGLEPIKAELQAIEALGSREELVRRCAHFMKTGVPTPFIAFIDQDAKQSTQYIVNLYQGGLSMPDRDYYLSDNPRLKEIRAEFLAHLERIFTMAGYDNAARRARTVYGIEEALARHHWTRVENRDREKTYNKFALADFDANSPSFDWRLLATEAGMGSIDSLRVYQPSYFEALDKIFASTSLDDWKTFYAWKTITRWAPYLDSAFVAEDFHFFRRVLSGVEENRPRWQRAVASVNNALGELVGRLYVARHFTPEAKERMTELVANLKSAFRQRITELDWMTDATKQKALAKLEKFNTKIGYPDTWKDYSKLEITADDLVGNIRRSSIVEYDREVDKLGKPIDRSEWFMTPQMVNAYYAPSMNEVVFPAAILQPPFFNMAADEAVNYGAIGAVIGHEMTHGFDDQGRKSDGDGNLRDWWTDQDGKEFDRRADVMVAQADAYTAVDTLHLNGRLTLGENIGDLGGMRIAHLAYKRSLGGSTPPVIDGFTGEQRFFLGWAQVWGTKYREDFLRQLVLTDPHSPGPFRVNGVMANMPEFQEVYGVKEGDALYRPADQMVQIW
jgi:endothelin-converting enzyme/putative endopeptidase